MNILLTIIILGVIVVSHEFGHFIIAKANGIVVKEFCIGFGPTIIGIQRGETKYCLKAIPMGGACIFDMDDVENPAESSFYKANVWSRIGTIAAGPIFNFILAFILSLFVIGNIGYPNARLLEVSEGGPAQKAGIMAGDEIVKINNYKVHMFSEISLNLMFTDGEPVDVEYIRDGQKYKVTLIPEYNEEYGRYMFGIVGGEYETEKSPIKTIKYAAYYVRFQIASTFKSLKWLVLGKVASSELAGPVGVATIVGEEYDNAKSEGLSVVILTMLNLAILLSANLGVMNLLPIPALDGGRLVFMFIEVIFRKPIPPEKEGIVHFIGVAILIGLTFYALYNDVMRIIIK